MKFAVLNTHFSICVLLILAGKVKMHYDAIAATELDAL
jgi:hypothetical protein